MKKSKIISLVIIFSSMFFAMGKAEVRTETITYLKAQEQNEWISQALKAAGETNISLDYLASAEITNANEASRAILAVVAAGFDPTNYNSHNLVSQLQGFANNQQIGSIQLLNDDFWGIMALASAGVDSSNQTIQDSKNFILHSQNTDGGWGFAPSTTSDTNDTAAALMALLETGLSSNNQALQNGLSYLRNSQRTGGGWGFYTGSDSDSGSTAWVVAAINKMGEDPNVFRVQNQTPFNFLNNLALADGSYKWITTSQTGDPLMTAYVAVALSNKYYPVAKIANTAPVKHLKHLRIEAPDTTLCNSDIEATDALSIIEAAESVCHLTISIKDTAQGRYLEKINNYQAEGTIGWQYFVNWQKPNSAAAAYQLQDNDQVLWAFGNFNLEPLKITLATDHLNLNQNVSIKVESYDNTSWQAVSGATVKIGNQTLTTDSSGQVNYAGATNGSFEVLAEKDGLIRSQRLSLQVGDGNNQTVSLRAEIVAPVSGGGGGGSSANSLAFSVDTLGLNFGKLTSGESAIRTLTITNQGNSPLYLESSITGDQLFTQNTSLNNQPWDNFNLRLNERGNSQVAVKLKVPSDYQSSGIKNGQMIFWAGQDHLIP